MQQRQSKKRSAEQWFIGCIALLGCSSVACFNRSTGSQNLPDIKASAPAPTIVCDQYEFGRKMCGKDGDKAYWECNEHQKWEQVWCEGNTLCYGKRNKQIVSCVDRSILHNRFGAIEKDSYEWRRCNQPGASNCGATDPSLSPTPQNACCKYCSTGKACGDSCIDFDKECNVGPGCACNG